MSFITLCIACDEEKRELLIAELSLFPFSAFEETDDGLLAACEESEWTEESEIMELLGRYDVPYVIDRAEKVNWNEEWEKNYDPVIVEDQCIVRATFHPSAPAYPYEIIITPKMSFGTGHHSTTWQVLKYLLRLDTTGKKVLDVGCGTGVLAILAHMKGADDILAIDIDDWCIENSTENFTLNHCESIEVTLGGIEVVEKQNRYDLILANINKNVLLDQISVYSTHLQNKGTLILSGFYKEDISDLMEKANECNLKFVSESERDRWAMLVLEKS